MAVLRTPPAAPSYDDEWQAFVRVLDAHAGEEERDVIPPPVDLNQDFLVELGNRMLARIDQLRESTFEKLHVKGRAALLRAM